MPRRVHPFHQSVLSHNHEIPFVRGVLGFPLSGLNDRGLAGGMGMGDDVKFGEQFGVGQPLLPDKVLWGVRCCVGSASTIGSRLNWTSAWFIWSRTLLLTCLALNMSSIFETAVF